MIVPFGESLVELYKAIHSHITLWDLSSVFAFLLNTKLHFADTAMSLYTYNNTYKTRTTYVQSLS